MPHPFEQQPRESHKAFAAFSLYLSLGPQRSLEEVGRKLGKSKVLMERWSSKFDWVSRVQAQAAHMAIVEREAAEAMAREKGVDWVKRQEEQRSAEWQARSDLVELAKRAIERWKKNENKCGTLEGIARLLDLASKLGRLASGMPTDRTEVTREVRGKIDMNWEIALRKVYGSKEAKVAAPPAYVDVETLPAPPAQPKEGV
jgi:hypothetical protein